MIKITALFILIVLVSLGNCSQTPVKPDEEQHLELIWEHQYVKESASISIVANSPTLIDENGLLLAIDYGITKINNHTGVAEWRYDLPEGSRFGNRKVLFDNSAVYVKHNMNNSSSSIDLETGDETWWLVIQGEKFFDAISDIISDEHLFWGSKDIDIYQVRKTGEQINKISLNYRLRSGHYFNGNLIIAQSYSDKDRAQNPNHRFGKILSYDLDADTVK
jgi:outer membrane protein assembly factor BamB